VAQFCGQLHDRICRELKSTFGFVDLLHLMQREDIEKAIAHNCKLVASIQNTFHYKVYFLQILDEIRMSLSVKRERLIY